ncbi:MAG: hypothetical protein AAGA18_15310 [Verrucomicrobiota bacterium]
MKNKLALLLLAVGTTFIPVVAQANDSSLMCGPDAQVYQDGPMCSMEQYGFTLDDRGNMVPDFTLDDSPTISTLRPENMGPPPRNIIREAEILNGSPLASGLYGLDTFLGFSHEDAMNFAEFGYHAGNVAGSVAGNGSAMLESPVPGLAGSSTVIPHSPLLLEQQLGDRGRVYSH